MAITNLKDNFDKTLLIGEEVESQFLEVLKQRDKEANKIGGNHKYADFVCDGKTYELKYDVMSDITGNFAFEFRFKGKWSGISATTSDYWVIADKDSFYEFETSRVRDFIKLNWDYLKKLKGGDENLSELILISKEDLLDNVRHRVTNRQPIC